jgi:hypothetical protein
VQLDAEGRVVPTRGVLEVPQDSLSRLVHGARGRDGGDHVVVTEPVRPRAIVQLAHEADVVLRQASRGLVLHRLGSQAMNLPVLGGGALAPLARMVSVARPYETTWVGERRFLDVLPAAAAGRALQTYDGDRREDTPEGR